MCAWARTLLVRPARWPDCVQVDAALRPIAQKLLYLEQPMPRDITRQSPLGALARRDFIVDEADDSYDAFPVARVPGLDFSFSGLKTALLYSVRHLRSDELARRRADLAASYQRAIVRALVGRVEAAGGERIAVVGGVAANSELRASLPDATPAPLSLCTDNAAMIASAARFATRLESPDYLRLDAYASAA